VPFIDDMAARFGRRPDPGARQRRDLRRADGGGQGRAADPVRAGGRRPSAGQRGSAASGGRSADARERGLTGESLGAASRPVEHPERIEAMEGAARLLGRPDAAARVADLLEDGIR
jgi:hypothetical protein